MALKFASGEDTAPQKEGKAAHLQSVLNRIEPGNPFLSFAPTGLKIIEFEAGSGKYSKEDVLKAQGAYLELYEKTMDILKEKGLDRPKGMSWTQQDIVNIYAEISSILWSNVSFSYNSTNNLIDGFLQLAAKKSSKTAHLDCDTSAFFVADIFSNLWFQCHIIDVPEHAFLKVSLGESLKVWLETTRKKEDIELAYYTSYAQMKKSYPAVYGEELFSDNMGILLYNRGYNGAEKQQVIEDQTAALKNLPGDPAIYIRRGNAKDDLGDHKGAIADFDMAIKLEPSDSSNYFFRGYAKSNLGDKQGAIADYSKAIRLNPKYSAAYFNRGYAKSSLGDDKGAIADYSKAILLDPKDVEVYCIRGNAKSSLGDKKGAIADYDIALRLNPSYANAYRNRAYAKSSLGDEKGAIADFSKVIELDPSNSGAYNNRGYAKSSLGDYNGAIADYSKAIEFNPANAKAYNNRGDAKLKLGQTGEAAKDFEKVLEIDPKNESAKKSLTELRKPLADERETGFWSQFEKRKAEKK